MRALVVVVVFLGTVNLLFGVDVLHQGNNQVPLGRHKLESSEFTSRFEWALPVVVSNSWLTVGPFPPGQVFLQLDPEAHGPEARFPELSGTQVWLAWKLSTGLHTLRVTTNGLPPGPLTLTLSQTLPNHEPLEALSGSRLALTLPSWQTAPGYTPALEFSWHSNAGFTAQNTVRFQFSGRAGTWLYYPQVWHDEARRWLLTFPSDAIVPLYRVKLVATPNEAPLPADPASILHWPLENLREGDHDWFLWNGRRNILILLTKSYALQAQYLTRLAFFVEKQGYRGTILTEQEALRLHGWNAHDYAPEDLANFFNLVSAEDFPLSAQERELRQRLITQKLLIPTSPGHWKAGQGALLGISDESSPPLRSFLLTHESFHGLYFTTPRYRHTVTQIWNQLTPLCRQQFSNFLAQAHYDVTDLPLVVNEFQAYSLQQDSDGWSDFFSNKVLKAPGRLDLGSTSPLRESLLTYYLQAAEKLDQAVSEDFGLHSGNIQDPIVHFLAGRNSLTLAPP
ncbi:MAG: hypothetical protein HKM05_06900 [Spirochaetales bacterium]|nr:hypothetical protein [Spirochaetales bacterium]